jgi:uncharacterized protein GlcG (DUF336 family)
MRAATLLATLLVAGSTSAWAQAKPTTGCGALPSHDTLRSALQSIIKQGQDANTGLGNQEWAALVSRDGAVCTIAFSGKDRGSQWPGSRLIAAEKASTANALSVDNFALSTANLYYPSQPGQSLFSLTTSAPPSPAAYAGDPELFGQANDPLVGKPIGGIIVFGGGLALYSAHGKVLGGLGLSGDTSCADHVIAWKLRRALKLDAVPGGVAPGQTDNMILDLQNGVSASGFGHPSCVGGKPSDDMIKKLPQAYPTGPKE